MDEKGDDSQFKGFVSANTGSPYGLGRLLVKNEDKRTA
jgi:hypothetical protein